MEGVIITVIYSYFISFFTVLILCLYSVLLYFICLLPLVNCVTIFVNPLSLFGGRGEEGGEWHFHNMTVNVSPRHVYHAINID